MYDIPILMLHSVNDDPDSNPMGELSVSSRGLESYLKVFKNWKYQMISMDDFLNSRFDSNRNFVILTFDDGYKDNLTVALPLLKKYKAHATIFVNPEYVSKITDKNSDWGFMTWKEIQRAHDSGVFDIQAHTMTHEFIFTSEKIIDYYTHDKFRKYYWLAWMLYPDAPREWNGDANKYMEMIPIGYPVFEYGRRISNKRFIPDQSYIEFVIECYNNSKPINEILYQKSKGEYESPQEYDDYVRWEIEECKSILEKKLNKQIHTLCFPGGGYTDFALTVAKSCGFKCYMTTSRMRFGNNNDHYTKFQNGEFVGFNRTSFSLIHPGVLPDYFFDYCIAKLSLGTFQNLKRYSVLKKVFSKIWHNQ